MLHTGKPHFQARPDGELRFYDGRGTSAPVQSIEINGKPAKVAKPYGGNGCNGLEEWHVVRPEDCALVSTVTLVADAKAGDSYTVSGHHIKHLT